MPDFAVDHVYTWVNSSDENVSALRAEYLGVEHKPKDAYSAGSARFADNGELRASLINAREFLPFVRTTWIVGSGSPPSWLGEFGDAVRYVHQDEILPEIIRPIFQSDAVEAYIHNIPSLAEHYIYSNDDYFFADVHQLTDFFPSEGHTRVGLAHWAAATGGGSTYQSMEENSIRALQKRVRLPGFNSGYPPLRKGLRLRGRMQRLLPLYFRLATQGLRPLNAISHVSQPYIKSAWAGFHALFSNEIKQLTQNKFRSDNGVCINFMYQYYLHNLGKSDFHLSKQDRMVVRTDSEETRMRFKTDLLSNNSSVRRFCLNDVPVSGQDDWEDFVAEITSCIGERRSPNQNEPNYY